MASRSSSSSSMVVGAERKAGPCASRHTATSMSESSDDCLDIVLGNEPIMGSASLDDNREGRKGRVHGHKTQGTTAVASRSSALGLPDIGQLALSDTLDSQAVSPRSSRSTSAPTSPPSPPTLQTPSSCRHTGWSSTAVSASPFTPLTSLPSYSSQTSWTHLTPAKKSGGRSSPGTGFDLWSGKRTLGEQMAVHAWPGQVDRSMLTAAEVGRYLMIANIPLDVSAEDIKNVVKRLARFKVLITKHLDSQGCVIIAFFDSRQAAKVYHYLATHSVSVHPNISLLDLHCMPISREEVEKSASKGGAWQDFWNHIEPVVEIRLFGSEGLTVSRMKDVCGKIGDIQDIRELGNSGVRFAVEFYDTRHATEAIDLLDGCKQGGRTISVRYNTDIPSFESKPEIYSSSAPREFRRYQSDPVDSIAKPAENEPPLRRRLFGSAPSTVSSGDVFGPLKPTGSSVQPRRQTNWSALRTASASTSGDDSLPRPYTSFPSSGSRIDESAPHFEPPSPLPRASLIRQMPHASLFAADHRYEAMRDLSLGSDPTFGTSMRRGAVDKKAISPDKRIDLDLIAQGQEWRTTVMVKDVPNKLSRQELVDILRDVVPGGFDFVYVRFDFNNGCNFGYAFVNFTSHEALQTFHARRVGKKWNLYSSEKVLQICWADTQGKDYLINKFRNSDVMTAPEPWRPQIFYSDGPLQGLPEPFPERIGIRANHSHYAAQQESSGLDHTDTQAYNYTSADFDASYGC